MLVYAIHFSPGASYAAAIVAVAGFFALLTLVGNGHIHALVVGKDGRTSTSKLQTFLWTIMLAFALLALILQGVTDIDIVPDYLYLLGFPTLALLLSKSIVQQKITNGDVVKVTPTEAASGQPVPAAPAHAAAVATGHVAPAAATPTRSWRDWLGDIINNDEGQPDLGDFQYVVFNLIALVYFVIHFFDTPGVLPKIPQTLLVLTGASAAGYVGNKLVQNQTPVLTGVAPPSALPNALITLRGTNLNAAGSGAQGGIAVTSVAFDTATVAPTSVSDTAITVAVPPVTFDQGAASKLIQISVTNAVASQSNQIAFTVLAPGR
jgi:IPT/TIG domain-containing protein